ncbi:hypothetical protein MAJ_11046, partial [Metarhizium majus ARSEF 297]
MENVQFVQFDDNASPRSSPRPKSRPVPTPSEAIQLPGYGLPLNYLPPRKERFPVLMGDRNKDWKATTLLIREVCMLKFMEDITNKPEWWRKVCDPNIAARWKHEVLSLNWTEYRKHGDFTKNMAEMCIQELRKKAALYEETSLIPVMDHSTCVIKSDKLVSEDLTERLKTAVKSLEDVPDSDKDWHPGSDGKVLDLVHPSLFPLLYGRSRIMRHQRIGLDECLNFCGRGFLLEKPGDNSESQLEATIDWRGAPIEVVSPRFQWLPCDVAIDEDGRATIESYINNLHPKDHAAMYPVIEEFIQKSLPAWDLIYRWVKRFPVQRLTARKPFKLEDPTKPGHRKILALFLVDPAIPVISTSNVPPQQRHWYTSGGQSEAVATVLQNMDSIMELDEAKKLREELMAERTVLQQNVEDDLKQVEWSFCEH